jgi:predicted small lipoprotein YifL
MRNKLFKSILAILITVFMITVTACGAKKLDSNNAATSKTNDSVATKEDKGGFGTAAPNNAKPEEKSNTNNTSQNPVLDKDRKIIKSANINLETVKFEESINNILKEVETKGGYVESSNIEGKRVQYEGGMQNRSGRITIRIPKNEFDNFINNIDSFGNPIMKSVNGEDITAQYFDSEARLKSLKVQEERMIELLKKAMELKDVVELEKHLSEVRYQIESLTGNLRRWDNMMDYSQVTITIMEVAQLTPSEKTPITLGEKITTGFQKSVNNLVKIMKGSVVAIAVMLPYAVIIAVLAFITGFILKKKKINIFPKRNKEK